MTDNKDDTNCAGERNLTPHQNQVSDKDRMNLLRQSGCVLWFTGLSGAGKSTIAGLLEKRLIDSGHQTYVLDGDNIRCGLNSDLGFSPEDRQENIRRISEVAALFADSGVITITAFISPYRDGRRVARNRLPEGKFIEVYVDTPIDICRQRDPKGLYAKADAGEIDLFTGVNSPYEQPEHPELHIETKNSSPVELVNTILEYLTESGILSAPISENGE